MLSDSSNDRLPLLPETDLSENPGCRFGLISGAVFNVSTTIIGAGIMSIPATFKVLGIVPALTMILVVASLVDLSVGFMLRVTRPGVATTYSSLIGESFGRSGSVLVQICVGITNFGCLIVYLIIIGDVLSGNQRQGSVHLGVLQEWFGFHWWNTRAFALLFIVLFILFPLVLFKRVESLRFSSAVAVFLAIVFVAISSVLAISAAVEGNTKSPRLFPDLHGEASYFELFTAVPVIVAAFTFHFNIHPISAELPNQSYMISAVRISLFLCATIYFVTGFFGYLLFGDSLMSDILINFDRSSSTPIALLLNDIVRLSYALHLVLVFPLMNFSLRCNVNELIFPKKPLLIEDTAIYMSITCSSLASAYLAAIAIPNIWYFFQFIGSTTAVCIAFIFPGSIVLRDIHGVSSTMDKAIATLMIILAVLTSFIAIFTNLSTITL